MKWTRLGWCEANEGDQNSEQWVARSAGEPFKG